MKSITNLSKRVVNISMTPLDEDATTQLAMSMTEGGSWPPYVINMILKSSEGVPKQAVKIIDTFINIKHVVVDKTTTPPKLSFADTKLMTKTITR